MSDPKGDPKSDPKSNPINNRIARELGTENLSELLSGLSGSDLHSLLLSIIKQRVENTELSKLLVPSKVSQACDLDARVINQFEQVAFAAAKQFEAVELSPLQPLGSVGLLGGLDQGNVLSTIRAFECASDPTVGLALECARRRKDPGNRNPVTNLCTSQRVVRFPVPDKPGFSAHFKLFCLVSAARDQGSFKSETIALHKHIQFYLMLLNDLAKQNYKFTDVTVELSDMRTVNHLCSTFDVDREHIKSTVRAKDSDSSARVLEKFGSKSPKDLKNPSKELSEFGLPEHYLRHLSSIDERVRLPLTEEFPSVKVNFNLHRLTGLSYYEGPCFHIKMKNPAGQTFMLGDGGFVNWTQLLLGDQKERLMTSAIGMELMCRLFRE